MAKIETFRCGHPRIEVNALVNKGYSDGHSVERCRYCVYVRSQERHNGPVRTFEQWLIMRMSGIDWRRLPKSVYAERSPS